MIRLSSFDRIIYVSILLIVMWIDVDLFLNNIETFHNLKTNILRVKEKVTLIDSSISKIEDGINKSTEPAIELKKRFEAVISSTRKVRQLKQLIRYVSISSYLRINSDLEKADKLISRGNLLQGHEILQKCKSNLDQYLVDEISDKMLSFLNSKIRNLEWSIKVCMNEQLQNWIENVQSEQERIGMSIRQYATDRLNK